jgi:hypothetical protein
LRPGKDFAVAAPDTSLLAGAAFSPFLGLAGFAIAKTEPLSLLLDADGGRSVQPFSHVAFLLVVAPGHSMGTTVQHFPRPWLGDMFSCILVPETCSKLQESWNSLHHLSASANFSPPMTYRF